MIGLETKTAPSSMLGSISLRFFLSIITLLYFSLVYYTRGQTFLPVQELVPEPSPSPSALSSAPNGSADFQIQPSRYNFGSIRNSTLGFQEIFVLNLPSRADKLDTFTLLSAATDFTFKVLPGVDGKTVPKTAFPFSGGFPVDPVRRRRNIGSWRAHLNFAQRIVQNRLSTALLFEDDADWDVDLKSQLELVAQGTRALSSFCQPSKPASSTALHQEDEQNTTENPHSPYGDDWDLLWLGHCGATLHKDSKHLFRIDNDPTVAPDNHRTSFKGSINTTAYPASTRLVFRQGGGLCVYAYALSYRGAQKLLLNENNRKEFANFDNSIDHLCGSGSKAHGRNKKGGWQGEFRCLSVYPQIVDSHKAAGSILRDSDINNPAGTMDEERETGYTFNIVRSVRLNIEKLLLWGGWEAMREVGDKAAASLRLQWDDQPAVTEEIRMGIEEVSELEPVRGMLDE